MRLIDADALVKCVNIIFGLKPDARWSHGAVLNTIDAAPTIGGWTSVKDGLPNRYKKVLTYGTDYGVQENWLIRVGKEISWSMGYHITHWMPLPEPPEEAKQKHGHWVRLPKFLSEAQCSVCKETCVGDCRTFNYCPNCGTKMDGEVEVKRE